MPWQSSSAKKFTKKASTPSKRKKWAKIASGYLKSHPGEEASAIKIANAAMDARYWNDEDTFLRDAWNRDARRRKVQLYNARGDEEGTEEWSEDAATISTPLLIRLLEYAREDAKTDIVLHKIAERLDAAKGVQRIDQYSEIVPEDKKNRDSAMKDTGWTEEAREASAEARAKLTAELEAAASRAAATSKAAGELRKGQLVIYKSRTAIYEHPHETLQNFHWITPAGGKNLKMVQGWQIKKK